MTLSLNTLSNSAHAVCPMLRTKTAFGSYITDGDDTPWHASESTTAVYWCLRTMCSAGPDEDFVHPSICQGTRSCFRAGDD